MPFLDRVCHSSWALTIIRRFGEYSLGRLRGSIVVGVSTIRGGGKTHKEMLTDGKKRS